MNKQQSLNQINQFESHYDYDCTYMREMIEVSPDGFATFEAFLPMGRYAKATPVDVLWVAKLTSMRAEDCGGCVDLNIKMAKEAGIGDDVIDFIVKKGGKGLDDRLKRVYDFSLAVTINKPVPSELREYMHKTYSPEVMVELALAIASTKVYPAIKRTLGYANSCSL